MNNLVCLLEETSAKKMLEGILPRMLPDTVSVKYIAFEGKQDLEKNIKSKMQGWQVPNSVFLVMCDQDSDDCKDVKNRLSQKIQASGKLEDTVIRIACHELESFYLGHLEAIEKGLNISGIARNQHTKKFRDPDNLGNAFQELSRLTNNQYQKVAGSRAISPHLLLDDTNRSTSFQMLLGGLTNAMEKLNETLQTTEITP